MSLIKRMRRQKAVYWALQSEDSGGDDFDDYGQPLVVAPVEIDCRWEDSTEEFIDADGVPQMSRAIVYVDRDVDVGGVLMLGTLADVDDVDNPKINDAAWEIKRFDNFPDLKAKEFLKTAYL